MRRAGPGQGIERKRFFGFWTGTLTNGSDSVISGAATVGTTTPGVTVMNGANITVNAPLSGIGGFQPSLTSGDVIQLQSTQANALNANFNGGSTVTGVTIQNAQTWTINQAGGGSVFIQGAPAAIDGVTTLTFNGNGLNAENLQVGIPGAGIDRTTAASGFNLNISNVASNPVTGIVTVYFDPLSFHGGDQINVHANAVTNTLGGTVTSQPAALFINAGSGGAAGFATWNVNSTGANSVNDIALGALGSTAARTLNITDDGSTTIIWNDAGGAEWAGLTTINAAGTTGALTVTGGEFGPNGLLSGDTTALTMVQAGSGTDLFDLSAYAGSTAQVAGLSIFGSSIGTTTIELNNAEINKISGVAQNAFANWQNVAVLDDVGSPGTAHGEVGGPFNMADFPGTLTVSLLSSSSGLNPDQTAPIVVTKAPDGLNFDFNSTDQHGNNFSVAGSDTAGGAANVVNVNYGAFPNANDSTGTFASSNFDHVNINLTGAVAFPELVNFYFNGLAAVANADGAETMTINASLTHGGGGVEVLVGNVTSQALGGGQGVTLLGGPIVVSPPFATFTDTGTLDITGTDKVVVGVTNASTIASTTTGPFWMSAPDDVNSGGAHLWTAQNHDTVSSTSAGSLLQGTLIGTGPADLTPGTGVDSLTDLAGGTSFFGDGGADNITIGGGGNNIHIGEFVLNINFGTDTPIVDQQTVDAAGDASLGFWGATTNGQAISGSGAAIFGTAAVGGTSADMTTVTGFTIGASGDALTFHSASFGGGLTDPATMGHLSPLPTTAAGDAFAIGFAGESIPANPPGAQDVRIVLDEISQFSSASDLAHSLVTPTVGDITLAKGVAAHTSIDILVAYEVAGGGAINVAEVMVDNTTGGTLTSTAAAGMHVYAQDLVHLTGISFGLTELGINAGEIHFA